MRLTQTVFISATMLAAPAIGVLAQTANPTGNYGNRPTNASPGTTGSQAPAGGSGSAYSPTRPSTGSTAATNPNQPGATGRTVVPGTSSSMSDTSGATRDTQTQAGPSGGTNR
jgi:hypothetical protein